MPELKMRTVSISHLTRQLHTVTGCFLTPVCSKHLSPCTCIFSYQVSTAWLCHSQPHPAHHVPAQPLYFGEGERYVQWRSDVVTQKGNRISHFMLPSPASPCLVLGSHEVHIFCLPQETPCFPPAIFIPLFICSLALAPAIAKLCCQ